MGDFVFHAAIGAVLALRWGIGRSAAKARLDRFRPEFECLGHLDHGLDYFFWHSRLLGFHLVRFFVQNLRRLVFVNQRSYRTPFKII